MPAGKGMDATKPKSIKADVKTWRKFMVIDNRKMSLVNGFVKKRNGNGPSVASTGQDFEAVACCCLVMARSNGSFMNA